MCTLSNDNLKRIISIITHLIVIACNNIFCIKIENKIQDSVKLIFEYLNNSKLIETCYTPPNIITNATKLGTSLTGAVRRLELQHTQVLNLAIT